MKLRESENVINNTRRTVFSKRTQKYYCEKYSTIIERYLFIPRAHVIVRNIWKREVATKVTERAASSAISGNRIKITPGLV